MAKKVKKTPPVLECPRCGQTLSEESVKSLWGRYTSALSRVDGVDDVTVKEDSCGEMLTGEEVKSLNGRMSALKRTTHGAGTGRPRSGKKRCPCKANTLSRAKARNFDCCRAAEIDPKRIDRAQSRDSD